VGEGVPQYKPSRLGRKQSPLMIDLLMVSSVRSWRVSWHAFVLSLCPKDNHHLVFSPSCEYEQNNAQKKRHRPLGISDIKFQQPLYLWLECCLSLWGPHLKCSKLWAYNDFLNYLVVLYMYWKMLRIKKEKCLFKSYEKIFLLSFYILLVTSILKYDSFILDNFEKCFFFFF
jgi:hypothetical protein